MLLGTGRIVGRVVAGIVIVIGIPIVMVGLCCVPLPLVVVPEQAPPSVTVHHCCPLRLRVGIR